jgi:hypothetical protein
VKRKTTAKIFNVLFKLTFITGFLFAFPMTVTATDLVPYINALGAPQAPVEAVEITDDSSLWWDAYDSPSGWFYIPENTTVTITERLFVTGWVNLILSNGATLNANAGINVWSRDRLTIWANSTDEAEMGKLIATAIVDSGAAGIGGRSGVSAGNITIQGGMIKATGSDSDTSAGAGIGGGNNGRGETTTINGGIVTAIGGGTGLWAGAGIGGGGAPAGTRTSGGTITINNGHVTAITGGNASSLAEAIGIGGRADGIAHIPERTVIINGQFNWTTNTLNSPAVGSLASGVTAFTAANADPPIGGRELNNLRYIRLEPPTVPVITTTSLPNANSGTDYSQTLFATASGSITWSVTAGALPDGLTLDSATGVISGNIPQVSDTTTFNFTVQAQSTGGTQTQALSITVITSESVPYINASGEAQTPAAAVAITSDLTGWNTINSPNGWYYVPENTTVTITERPTVTGKINLILSNGATLNANAGITVILNNLTIWANSSDEAEMGKLIATGNGDNAGIGGGGVDITINGGIITATGGSSDISGGAGIGAGSGFSGGATTINGGIVTAIGGGTGLRAGAGIGAGGIAAGTSTNAGTININGGQVTAIAGGSAESLAEAIGRGGRADGILGTATRTVSINGQFSWATNTLNSFTGGSLASGVTEFAGANANPPIGGRALNTLRYIKLAPPTAPVITTTSLPNGISGAAYSQTLTATGSEPITWSITDGALPDGLTLDSATGDISGGLSIDDTETFDFTVTATNNIGSDEKPLSITVIFVVPPTGIPGITGLLAAMLALLAISAALWACLIRRKKSRV